MANVQSVLGNRVLAAGKAASAARIKVGNTMPLIAQIGYQMEKDRAEYEEKMALVGQISQAAKTVAANFEQNATMQAGAKNLADKAVKDAVLANPKLTEQEQALYRMDREKYYAMPSVNPLAAKDVKGFFGNLLNAFRTGFLGPNLGSQYGDTTGKGLLVSGRMKKMGYGDMGAEMAPYKGPEEDTYGF